MQFPRCILLILTLSAAYTGRTQQTIDWWLTTSDKAHLLSKQSSLVFKNFPDPLPSADSGIVIMDPSHTFQSIDGFGFALTGGSAQVLYRMTPLARQTLLHELFGKDEQGISISYLRLSIGASDLNDHTFSYDDLPPGQTDTSLYQFTLKEDEKEVIPVLQEILAIDPHIKILGSPWSAPLWMKTNHNIQGGVLAPEYYDAYARYFVKYITAMAAHGIIIDAITVQNEPFNDGNTPSMQFLAKQELRFIRDHLGPAFVKHHIATKIILYDHNCDAPEYPISIMADPVAKKYVDGSGFHLYAGAVSAMSKVHDAFPDRNLYFTEMMVTNRNDFNVPGAISRIAIGAVNNWSRNVILWNLGADERNQPHTDNGGCAFCQGAVTVKQDSIWRNAAYYTIAHFSKFVRPGARRISAGPYGAGFETQEGQMVLVLTNTASSSKKIKIFYNGRAAEVTMPPSSAATFTWKK